MTDRGHCARDLEQIDYLARDRCAPETELPYEYLALGFANRERYNTSNLPTGSLHQTSPKDERLGMDICPHPWFVPLLYRKQQNINTWGQVLISEFLFCIGFTSNFTNCRFIQL